MTSVPSSAPEISSDTGEQSPPIGDSIFDRLRGVFSRVRQYVSRVAPLETPLYEESARQQPNSRDQTVQFERFPDRSYPLTHPGRDLTEINPTDVVAIEIEAGVRFSIPENPDATIVSDQWVLIER